MQIKNPVRRYHRLDGWRGYPVPALAVLGASVYDDHSDQQVAKEVSKFRREVLRPLGIKSRGRWGQTSNVFCGKWWICIPREQFKQAAVATLEWLKKNDRELQYLHDADLKILIEEDGCPA